MLVSFHMPISHLYVFFGELSVPKLCPLVSVKLGTFLSGVFQKFFVCFGYGLPSHSLPYFDDMFIMKHPGHCTEEIIIFQNIFSAVTETLSDC